MSAKTKTAGFGIAVVIISAFVIACAFWIALIFWAVWGIVDLLTGNPATFWNVGGIVALPSFLLLVTRSNK